MIVIGLTGKAGSGKDTVADRLVARHGFEKLSFARPLKDMLLKVDPIIGMDPMFPATPIHLSTALEKCGGEAGVKKLFPLYRTYLQKLGTEGVRSIDPEFWIKAALKEIDKRDRGARLVFTDCRFPNEADMIHYKLGRDIVHEVWQVNRRNRDVGEVAPHSSEQYVGQLNEDIVVDNNATLDDLDWIVDELAGDLKEVEGVKLAA